MNQLNAISGFLNKDSAKNLIALTFVNNTSRSQTLTLFDTSSSAETTYGVNSSNIVTVGSNPQGMAFDPVNDRIYVANATEDSVSVISTISNTVIATIAVNDNPRNIAFDSLNNRMYVTCAGTADTVDVISTATNTVITTIAVGNNPEGIAFDSLNNRMYVANLGGDVSVISTASNTVITTIITGAVAAVAFDSLNNTMYVCGTTTSMFVISTATNTITDTITIETGVSTRVIAFDSVNNRMYVTNQNSSTVSAISTASNTIIATISTGSSPRGCAFDPVENNLYVADFSAGTITIIDTLTNTVAATITGFAQNNKIVYNSNNNSMYFSRTTFNTVFQVTVAATITTNTVLSYSQICQALSANPILLKGLDIYDLSNNYSQVLQPWGFVHLNLYGQTETDYMYPTVNPGAYQPTKQNLPIPKDFVLDGENYITYTILANQTIQLFFRYNQAIDIQGGEIPVRPEEYYKQDTGRKLLFAGWINSKWDVKLKTLEELGII